MAGMCHCRSVHHLHLVCYSARQNLIELVGLGKSVNSQHHHSLRQDLQGSLPMDKQKPQCPLDYNVAAAIGLAACIKSHHSALRPAGM